MITYDRDMTLKIFVNNELESFDIHTVALTGDAHLAGAEPPYLLADFGSGTLSLAAPVSRLGQISLIILQGDGTGGFRPATGEVPLEPVRGTATTTLKTAFIQTSGTPAGSFSGNINVRQTMVGQFRSSLHGNSKPDFAFVTQAMEVASTVGNCPGDTQPLPAPAKLRHPPVCPMLSSDPEDCPPHHTPCFSGICCNCNNLHIPLGVRCPNRCPDFQEPVIPFAAVCDRTSTFTPVLTVFTNTCGD